MTKIFIAVSLFAIFSSCKKEVAFNNPAAPSTDTTVTNTTTTNTTNSTNTKAFLVKNSVATINNSSDEYNYLYDDQGRLLSRISPTGENKYIYKYNSDNSFTMDFFKNDVLSLHDLYYVNDLKFIDSTVRINYDTKDTTTKKNIFDANKLLVQVKEYNLVNGSSVLTNTTTAEYANGNVTREYNTNNNQIQYEYTNDLFTLNVGLIYNTRNKNLIKTATYSGFYNKVVSYSSTFDSLNRITSVTAKEGGNTISITIYNY
jgi:YD repeat-containing protein